MADPVFFQVMRYTQPPLILLGTIGAILNQILFFSRKQLRSSSCSLYFRALSANDLIVLYLVVFPSWYTSQFGNDPSRQFHWYCRMKTYLNYCFYTISPYLLVLACFDRLCTSSINANLRKIATIPIALILIPSMAIFVFLAYSHVPIYYQFLSFPTISYCYIPNAFYIRFISLFLLLFLCIIPPVLMIIFCSITLILLQQQRRRIMPVNQSRLRQRDNQLLKMLFIYVMTHVICTVPFAVTYVVYVFINSQAAQALTLFRYFSLLLNVNFSTSFYIYTLSTPFYRQELYNLFKAGRNRIIRPSTHILSVS